jgi:hypothetical protein
MTWTVSQEKLVLRWKEYARIRAVMHQRTASLYDTGHYTIGPLAVIITSISAATQFSQLGNCEDGASIAVIILTILGSVLSGLQTFFRFDKTSTQHRNAGTKYETLQHDIEETMAFEAQEREPPNSFIDRVKKELNSLMSNNLAIPMCIVDRYVKDVEFVMDHSVLAVPKDTLHPHSSFPMGVLHTDHTSEEEKQVVPEVAVPITAAVPDTSLTSEDDYQDAFAEAIRHRLSEQQGKFEAYQLNRLQTTFNAADTKPL